MYELFGGWGENVSGTLTADVSAALRSHQPSLMYERGG